ncbi:transferase family hexapeptide repeat protein [Neolewinella xylanilytica]|uniref:Transferase family hexapeptide repeat protein n=1 Tax=Neolewinella xylanilytica TaxID=1514080 RepID=A0A2S6I0S7_9BACT|nr:LpxA family transferase [Neolewinella xylanilytica]PPK84574.1 transferase family hexapeptide repeat protein [Neolewinella xylanilytica]
MEFPIQSFLRLLPQPLRDVPHPPWIIARDMEGVVRSEIAKLPATYTRRGGAAIHVDAEVEAGVVFKGPTIVSAGCHVKANAYFREGVWLGEDVTIGPGCEIKSSLICARTAIAHFNYIGNSLIGADVNFEAGSITANHFNERTDKSISVLVDGRRIPTGVTKFGAVVGDGCRIGANAVLSPGTILWPGTVVGRLQLVDQERKD